MGRPIRTAITPGIAVCSGRCSPSTPLCSWSRSARALAAGSASLQADALDFFGDAANYAISLFVIGMAPRVCATAALVKGISMRVFGLWILGTVLRHLTHGTLPSVITMRRVGIAAFTANAGSSALLWACAARATPTCARPDLRPQ